MGLTRIIILDDEQNMGKVLSKLLTLEGYAVEVFDDPTVALARIIDAPPAVVLTDLRMPGMGGEDILAEIHHKGVRSEVILMTAYGTVESALRCVRNGAFDYVTKPFDSKALVGTVHAAVEKYNHEQPRAASTPNQLLDPITDLVGVSQAMENVRQLLRRYAPTESPVLITGESGTGKELAAHAIHRLSRRGEGRFVAINCASIPESLMESELFGHEKGSFTGANETRQGMFEAADGGTLFLDEIGEMPLPLQAKLLRALQEREITRVGSVTSIRVDIRLVAATNRDLSIEVREGRFRQDLFYRLNVLMVRMPSLRDRREDVPILAEHFLAGQRTKQGRAELVWDGGLLDRFAQYLWPGNVRELQNTIERLAVLAEGDNVCGKGWDEASSAAPIASANLNALSIGPFPSFEGDESIPDFREARDRFEADYIRTVLKACGGNVSEAAKRSGMSRRNFYEKVEKLNIQLDEFK